MNPKSDFRNGQNLIAYKKDRNILSISTSFEKYFFEDKKQFLNMTVTYELKVLALLIMNMKVLKMQIWIKNRDYSTLKHVKKRKESRISICM